MYDSMYRTAGDMYGDGWWSDAKSAFHHGVSAIQHSDTVRAAEKALVKKGATALRGMAESATDGLADSALTALGAPELAPIADKLIDSGAKRLQKRGVDYLDQKIDQSGKGVRYMAATSPNAPPIPHAIKIPLFGKYYYWAGNATAGNECYRWPALNCDCWSIPSRRKSMGTKNLNAYLGSNPALKPGSLLAVPAALSTALKPRIRTAVGQKMLDVLTDYVSSAQRHCGACACSSSAAFSFTWSCLARSTARSLLLSSRISLDLALAQC
jgi:hypothetical protein